MQWTTVRNLAAAAAVAGGFVVYSGSASANPNVCHVSGNLVKNCGFEHGFNAWNSDFDYVGGFVTSTAAHSGNDGLLFDATDETPLYQSLKTTVGATYTISFWAEGSPYNTSDITVSWGGVPVTDVNDGTTVIQDAGPTVVYNGIQDAWKNYTFAETATTSSTVLIFELSDSSSAGYLDDITVTPGGAVPEPSSLAMFGAALLGLGLTRRQRVRLPACGTAGAHAAKLTAMAASALRSIKRPSSGATI